MPTSCTTVSIWQVAVLLLRGLDKRLTDKINIPFHIAEDPLHAVAKGTGVALKNVDRFSFLMR